MMDVVAGFVGAVCEPSALQQNTKRMTEAIR